MFDKVIRLTRPDMFENVISLARPDMFENVIRLARPDMFENVISLARSDMFENVIRLARPDMFENVISLARPDMFENVISLARPDMFENVIRLARHYMFENMIKLARLDMFENVIRLVRSDMFENVIRLARPDMFENLIRLARHYMFENMIKLARPDMFENVIRLVRSDMFENVIRLARHDIFENVITVARPNMSENVIGAVPRRYNWAVPHSFVRCRYRIYHHSLGGAAPPSGAYCHLASPSYNGLEISSTVGTRTPTPSEATRREIQLLQPYGWYKGPHKGPSTPPALSFGNDERTCTETFSAKSSFALTLERRMNKEKRPMTMSSINKAEEYATCIQADLKRGFKNCSFRRQQPIQMFSMANAFMGAKYCVKITCIVARSNPEIGTAAGDDSAATIVKVVRDQSALTDAQCIRGLNVVVCDEELCAGSRWKTRRSARGLDSGTDWPGLSPVSLPPFPPVVIYNDTLLPTSRPTNLPPGRRGPPLATNCKPPDALRTHQGTLSFRMKRSLTTARFTTMSASPAGNKKKKNTVIGVSAIYYARRNNVAQNINLLDDVGGFRSDIHYASGGRGSVMSRLRASHPRNFRTWESRRSIPLVGGFSRGAPFSPRQCIPALLHTHLASPTWALKTSMLISAQISSLRLCPNSPEVHTCAYLSPDQHSPNKRGNGVLAMTYNKVLRVRNGEERYGVKLECKSGVKREIPQKTRRSAASSGTIPVRDSARDRTRFPWWEARSCSSCAIAALQGIE
ncbi:hypothetical protein PR048_025994 [Dryococelus australis]|uniref:Uncharacterized protein n=1 Tax=Dryococelus australis TaxID=614101 RepID=A0ABQ9GK37_9NEOP|nr:hypothetical protein PR048_025994 [Dryococelus australis]